MNSTHNVPTYAFGQREVACRLGMKAPCNGRDCESEIRASARCKIRNATHHCAVGILFVRIELRFVRVTRVEVGVDRKRGGNSIASPHAKLGQYALFIRRLVDE